MSDETIEYPENRQIAVAGGNILPIGQQQITPAEIMEQIKSVVCMQYEGGDVNKLGMTLIEAALYSAAKSAAEGDLDALEKLLNRIMGKPIQQVQNLNMNASLKDFLDGVVRADDAAKTSVDIFSD